MSLHEFLSKLTRVWWCDWKILHRCYKLKFFQKPLGERMNNSTSKKTIRDNNPKVNAKFRWWPVNKNDEFLLSVNVLKLWKRFFMKLFLLPVSVILHWFPLLFFFLDNLSHDLTRKSNQWLVFFSFCYSGIICKWSHLMLLIIWFSKNKMAGFWLFFCIKYHFYRYCGFLI